MTFPMLLLLATHWFASGSLSCGHSSTLEKSKSISFLLLNQNSLTFGRATGRHWRHCLLTGSFLFLTQYVARLACSYSVIHFRQVMMMFGRAFDVCQSHRSKNTNKATDEPWHIKLPVLYKKIISEDPAFTTAIINEAHEFRNTGANWYAVLELMKAARLPLLLTATPLFTFPQIRNWPYFLPVTLMKCYHHVGFMQSGKVAPHPPVLW